MKKWGLLDRMITSLEHELGTEAYCTACEHDRALDLDTVLEDMLTISQAG
jgi:hypothetical protein